MKRSSAHISWDTANILEHAGISIGSQDNFLLQKKIQDLPARNARLWGKILGTRSDYYVIEGDTSDAVDFDKYTMEKPGYNGANLKAYWVCSSPGADLVELPNVTSAQVIASKQIKRFFTGDLNAPVDTFPKFPGNEANLLRAQICCISVATTLVPAGVFSAAPGPEDEEAEYDTNALVIEEDELMDKAVPTSEMADLGSWQFYYPGGGDLNSYGRCTKMPPRLDEEGEPIEDEEEPEFKEPMTGVGDDDTEAAKWSTKLVKDSLLVRLTNKEWPGAVCVGFGQPYPKCVNFYVGYGFKQVARGYCPPLAPPMQEEYGLPEDAEEEDYNGKLTEHPDLLVDPNKEEGGDNE